MLYFSSNLGIKNKYKTRVEECHTFCISLEMSSALDSTLDSTGGRNLQKIIKKRFLIIHRILGKKDKLEGTDIDCHE